MLEQMNKRFKMNFTFTTSKYFCCAALIALLTCTHSSNANDGSGSNSDFKRAGLTNEWFTHIEVGARSKIVNTQLQINEDKSTRYYLLEYGSNVERISQNDLNAFGEPRGIEGAEEYAMVRKEIVVAELAAQGRGDIEVKIQPITLPKSTIYAATSRGKVTAIDADTGQHLWQTLVGNPRHLTSGVGASKTHVALVNGSKVYCLNAENGRMLWSQECSRAPSAAPSVGELNIYVPLINGRLESFSIEKKGSFPKTYLSYGASVAKPLVTDATVSWATRKGFYAVAPFHSKSIQFRLNSGHEMADGGVFNNGVIYVTSLGGSIFALQEKTGSLLWDYSTGDRISMAPFVKNGNVFAISDDNRLYKIDSVSGLPAAGWEKPLEQVTKFVGFSRDRLYVLNHIQQLVSIDPITGAKTATIPGSKITNIIPNTQTDRIYVGTDRGLIRCYRESANTYPIFHANDKEMMVDAKDKIEDKKSDAGDDVDDPFAEDEFESDPFADDSSDDPFGGGDKDESDDPFGGDDSSDDGDDPFGSDDSDDESDPFGGGDEDESDDPFGG